MPPVLRCPLSPTMPAFFASATKVSSSASVGRRNTTFITEALEDTFVAEAKKAGMVGLKGHRSTGGIRASLYNAVSVEDVRTLTSFMDAFARTHG